MPKGGEDNVTPGSGQQAKGKTHKVDTRTIEVNSIADDQRVCNGEEVKKFRGKLHEFIQTRVGSTSSTKLCSNYSGRTNLAGFDAKHSGVLAARQEGGYQVNSQHVMRVCGDWWDDPTPQEKWHGLSVCVPTFVLCPRSFLCHQVPRDARAKRELRFTGL